MCLVIQTSFAQPDPLITKDTLAQETWVNNTYASLTQNERVAQLFMISVASSQDKAATDKLAELLKTYQFGGVIFSTGTPYKQAVLTNELQSNANIPLLVGMDAEWGLSMRLDSTFAYPWNMTLGAVQDLETVKSVGKRIGAHAKRLGVHINFAPDLDSNTNPNNPIIGNRSFGENPYNVAAKGIALAQGMESSGVLSCGKHFPGHGDTAVDSHKALPVLGFSKQRLDSVELVPFKMSIDSGVLSSVMIAHLNIPSLEPKKGIPSSFSKRIVSSLLQEQLGFKGLVFTDALNMKGASAAAKPSEASLQAFLAGNDMLLMPADVVKEYQKVIQAVESGVISNKRLAHSVKKILKAKYKAGLHSYAPIVTETLYEDLNTIADTLLYEKAISEAITVLKNEEAVVPIQNLEEKKIAYVHFGDANGAPFLDRLNQYAKVTPINGKDLASLKQNLKGYNLVIIGHHKSNETPWKGYRFSDSERFWVSELGNSLPAKVILAVFTKPYALLDIPSFDGIHSVVVGYQNSELAQQKTAELLFGAFGAQGKLPVSIPGVFNERTGLLTKELKRLEYSLPERVGMSSKRLKKVDTLVQHGLDSLMFPGAQVLVARHGKVVYNKAFGKPTYNSKEALTLEHVFDLASITKILATLPMVMKMEEEGKIALHTTFSELLPEYASSDLKDVTVLKALSHYGRLPAWIAFYVDTLDKNRKPSSEFYSTEPKKGYDFQVSDNLYITNAYSDSIYNRIGRQSLKSNRYRYSDVGYYVFKRYIENTYQKPLNELASSFLYSRLGATTMGYHPLKYMVKDKIVPTEKDSYYRYQTVQGYVHDMGAAMQGGVGGHAGLFSNANDVAKMMQMYLQDGYYGGVRYLNKRTVKKFNTCYFCDKEVRRGVGFDKPQLEDEGPTCGCVSFNSFGHSGFTGTYTWADPDADLVYVFLSNRTFPKASNTLLIKSGLRTRIQQAIYDAIIN
mgnify:CR=1 FL=1